MIEFDKMHGAGNDFIIVYNCDPDTLEGQIQNLCDRHRGVGADGLIHLFPISDSDEVGMVFYNCDGSRADMCGNGLRCAVRYSHDRLSKNPTQTHYRIHTDAGVLEGDVVGEQIRIVLPIRAAPQRFDFKDHFGFFLDSGVPHFVIETQNLETLDVRSWGRHYRFEKFPGDAGANVDFIEKKTPDTYLIRTYERGVEDETQACGTGCAAAGFLLLNRPDAPNEIFLKTPHSDTLTLEKHTNQSVFLTGPAAWICRGTRF